MRLSVLYAWYEHIVVTPMIEATYSAVYSGEPIMFKFCYATLLAKHPYYAQEMSNYAQQMSSYAQIFTENYVFSHAFPHKIPNLWGAFK